VAGIGRPSYVAAMANIASGLSGRGVTGVCCICGTYGKLSFEHIPPRRAFNDHGVFEADVKKMFESGWQPGVKPDGRINQKGAGRFTLCERCNNATGSWYGIPYIEVAKQAMELLDRSGGDVSLAYPYRMYPLRFLKQVVTMFFSACGPSLQETHPHLVRFVLNRETGVLPPNFQFYAYLHHPDSMAMRQSGLTGVWSSGKIHLFSEIAFPPFGLVMSVDGHPPTDQRLCNVTHLHQYGYRSWDVVFLRLPVLHVTTVLPGDFRTATQVRQDIGKNDSLGGMMLKGPGGVSTYSMSGSPYGGG
jgi:hypothetical protein